MSVLKCGCIKLPLESLDTKMNQTVVLHEVDWSGKLVELANRPLHIQLNQFET